MPLPKFLTNPNEEIFLNGKYLVLDFETTTLDKGDPNNKDNSILLCVTRSGETGDTTVHQGNEYELGGLLRDIRKHDFIVAQNAKFELGWLKRCGQDLTTILIYDTLLGKYTQDGNRHSRRDLNSLAVHYGLNIRKEQYISNLIHCGVDTRGIVPRWLTKYCVQDVVLTEEVFLKQRVQLQEQGLLKVMYSKCIFTPALADIESNGMFLDKTRVERIFNNYDKQHKELKREFDDFTGGINSNSPKQVAEYLYDTLGFSELTNREGVPIRSKTGRRVTDQGTITQLTARNKQQHRFIELFSSLSKIENKLSKYLRKMRDCCNEEGGLLIANFNQAVTKTHRLSSNGKKYKIQFQNLDRELKPVFTARHKGWVIAEADEAQLEFRAAAFLGKDNQAMRDIRNGVDVHAFTSSIIGCSRQDAKPHTFKPLYGGSSGTKAERKYYDAFKSKYYQITETQKRWVDEVVKTKKLVLPTGFVFHWPDVAVGNYGYVNYTTNIYNYPVQHFATAEIVPIGVTFLWHRMKQNEMEGFLVNTVHDSAIGELPTNEIELFTELAVQSLTGDVYEYLKNLYDIDFNVPLSADVVTGSHWAEKEGWKEKWLGVENGNS